MRNVRTNMFPKTKHQSREWHTARSLRPKNARMSKSKIKSMLICFFLQSGDSPKVICATRTNCQLSVIGKSLKDSGKGWHVCDQALDALGCWTTTTPQVTQQSPSMNVWQKKTFLWFISTPIRRNCPCDFFLFTRLKYHVKGRHFGILDNIRKSVTDEPKSIPAEVFQHCYEQWK